jgi:hypothetical protein
VYVVRKTVVMLVLVVAGLIALDGGSVVLTKLSSPDWVRDAGYKAAAVVASRDEAVPTPSTARSALSAARAEAQRHDITVDDDGFYVYADDRVDLTGVATAPTLFLRRIPFLEGLAQVSTTMTVEPRTMDSSGSTRGSNR